MAQIGKREFERISRSGGAQRGSGRQRPRVAEVLRIDEVPRATLAAIAVLATIAAVLGAVLLGRLDRAPVVLEGGTATSEGAAGENGEKGPDEDDVGDEGAEEGAGGEEGEAPATMRVHVAGAVSVPGVYALPEGARVVDAVSAAGGLTAQADPDGINLAEPLTDGCKVTVPVQGEQVASEVSTAAVVGADGAADGGKVNVNTATVEELDALPGVGAVLASEIARERDENGPFASPEDLMRVSGIGEKKLENMIDSVEV